MNDHEPTQVLEATDEPEFADDPHLAPVALADRRVSKGVTYGLGVALLLGIGFVGGMRYQKHIDGSSPQATSASGFPSVFASAGAGGRGAASASGGAGSASGGAGRFAGLGLVGTVSSIQGTSIYVTTASGNTVQVDTPGATFSHSVSGTLNDVYPGDSVVVRGAQQADGSYEAQSVTISAPGTGGGGSQSSGGFGGSGGSSTGGSSTGGSSPGGSNSGGSSPGGSPPGANSGTGGNGGSNGSFGPFG